MNKLSRHLKPFKKTLMTFVLRFVACFISTGRWQVVYLWPSQKVEDQLIDAEDTGLLGPDEILGDVADGFGIEITSDPEIVFPQTEQHSSTPLISAITSIAVAAVAAPDKTITSTMQEPCSQKLQDAAVSSKSANSVANQGGAGKAGKGTNTNTANAMDMFGMFSTAKLAEQLQKVRGK